ncbi:AP180 N-terminal homology (ANTH) domain [Dillenia turbinata]|uniref:AP180 N-terminal homology (ANTH) domain n=1 Tax=Dillenia turbinata TaxID=194707 RepID=A0AAN8UXQ7_9MAGN
MITSSIEARLRKVIGAVKDQTSIGLAKVASNNSKLEVAVLKAMSHDEAPIDEVTEILSLVSSEKAYAASCAQAIAKRISQTRNWIAALKSLMLVLKILQDGYSYFPREVLHAMKRGAKILNMSSFRDDSNSNPWDYIAFIRTVALYFDEGLDCFLTRKLQRRSSFHERGEKDGSRAGADDTSQLEI